MFQVVIGFYEVRESSRQELEVAELFGVRHLSFLLTKTRGREKRIVFEWVCKSFFKEGRSSDGTDWVRVRRSISMTPPASSDDWAVWNRGPKGNALDDARHRTLHSYISALPNWL